jgi:cytochrome o ubiquinol oxidase subunit II
VGREEIEVRSNDRPSNAKHTLPRDGQFQKFWRRACVVGALCLTGCQPAILDPQGPIGLANKTILIDSLAIMLAIVVPTIGATLGFAWWFRASNTRAQYLPTFAYSGRLELLVWSIPLLTIMLLGGVAWIGSHELDPAKPLESQTPALEIQAVSLDWRWLFIYPDQHVATINQLVVPAGVPLHFSLTSASVMNAFFIPQLGSMIYTMSGMTTQLNLQADTVGEFLGQSSHFSGDGFSDMHFNVQAVPADRFKAWVTTARGSNATLDKASYVGLTKQSLDSQPLTFRLTDDGLFSQIVTQQLPPGPGPTTGRPDVTISPRTGH